MTTHNHIPHCGINKLATQIPQLVH